MSIRRHGTPDKFILIIFDIESSIKTTSLAVENNPFKKIADEIITKEQRQKAMTKVSKVKRG